MANKRKARGPDGFQALSSSNHQCDGPSSKDWTTDYGRALNSLEANSADSQFLNNRVDAGDAPIMCESLFVCRKPVCNTSGFRPD